MKKPSKEFYYVAVKVFFEKSGRLFIFKDRFGKWDLPGGRLLKNEFYTSLEKVIARKIKEELGQKVYYKLGKPLVFMRHERKEPNPLGRPKVRIFAIGYRAKFISGEIKLSSMHTEYKWVQLKNLKPERYFIGGWLKGVKKYLCLRK